MLGINWQCLPTVSTRIEVTFRMVWFIEHCKSVVKCSWTIVLFRILKHSLPNFETVWSALFHGLVIRRYLHTFFAQTCCYYPHIKKYSARERNVGTNINYCHPHILFWMFIAFLWVQHLRSIECVLRLNYLYRLNYMYFMNKNCTWGTKIH